MQRGFASQRDEKDYQLDSQNPHHQQPSRGDSLAALGAARENQLRRMEGGGERSREQAGEAAGADKGPSSLVFDSSKSTARTSN